MSEMKVRHETRRIRMQKTRNFYELTQKYAWCFTRLIYFLVLGIGKILFFRLNQIEPQMQRLF